MLTLLCLIALFVAAGAQTPAPAVNKPAVNKTEGFFRLIDIIGNIVERSVESLKEGLRNESRAKGNLLHSQDDLKFPQSSHSSSPSEKNLTIHDELIGFLDNIGNAFVQKSKRWKEIVADHFRKEASSQGYTTGFAQSSPDSSSSEMYTTESAAVTSPYTTSRPSTSECGTSGEYAVHYENGHPRLIVCFRGIRGVNFPAYTEIPNTSFSCSSKAYIPGFYADLETGCQVFHVCWPHKRESFLCPVGTTFNQAILACDVWYSSNCSLAPYYYDINAQSRFGTPGKESTKVSMMDFLLEKYGKAESASLAEDVSKLEKTDLSYILEFLPVKAKVVAYPEIVDTRFKIAAKSSIGKEKTRHVRKATAKFTEEILGPEFITARLGYKSASPEADHKIALASAREKAAYAQHGLNSAVAIVHEVLDFVGNILRKTEVIYKAISSAKRSQTPQVHKTASTKQHRPLTKLNLRFITKPVEVSKTDMEHAKPVVIPNKGKAQASPTHAGDAKAAQTWKVYKSSRSQEQKISVTTKNALVQNYLRLLRMKIA